MQVLNSKDNINIKNAVKLKKSAKYRRETGLFIAEGVRLCTDAMKSGAQITMFFATEDASLRYAEDFAALSSYAEKTCLVSKELFAHIGDTQSPQGFLCVIKTLDKNCQFDTIKDSGKFLALDNVQDPNNLGAILRTAEAFGVSGVILSDDCCDVYNPKVVRGSMGAVFRLSFMSVNRLSCFFEDNPNLNTYAAVVGMEADSVTQTDFSEPCAVVIGNEGNGIRPQTLSACRHKITIPMAGRAESLNASVAAAVLIWEMVK